MMESGVTVGMGRYQFGQVRPRPKIIIDNISTRIWCNKSQFQFFDFFGADLVLQPKILCFIGTLSEMNKMSNGAALKAMLRMMGSIPSRYRNFS